MRKVTDSTQLYTPYGMTKQEDPMLAINVISFAKIRLAYGDGVALIKLVYKAGFAEKSENNRSSLECCAYTKGSRQHR